MFVWDYCMLPSNCSSIWSVILISKPDLNLFFPRFECHALMDSLDLWWLWTNYPTHLFLSQNLCPYVWARIPLDSLYHYIVKSSVYRAISLTCPVHMHAFALCMSVWKVCARAWHERVNAHLSLSIPSLLPYIHPQSYWWQFQSQYLQGLGGCGGGWERVGQRFELQIRCLLLASKP